MTLKLYNTLSKKKEDFVPLQGKEVKMYACGPTVYSYPHIGNYRAYVFEDLLRRYLEYKGNKVTLVMNITDVDDKTIKASGGDKSKLTSITRRYEKAFKKGLSILNIKSADEYPRATETIDEMVELIETLLEKEYAYKTDDGSVYFSIEKYSKYGRENLVQLDPKSMRAGERISEDEYDKEGIRDFVLWKAWKEEDGDIFWETSLGKGRPGWHIECSAMSMKYLGEELDIHCGGVDNIFPHHENEIAQSEAASGKKFVKQWMHCAHLIYEGEKMSKSLGNIILLEDLTKKYSPEAIRLALLSTHYRSQLDLTDKKLKEAEGNIQKITAFRQRMKRIRGKGRFDDVKLSATSSVNLSAGRSIKFQPDFEEALDDDLNISEALSALYRTMREANILSDENDIGKDEAVQYVHQLDEFDKMLGILPEKEAEIDESLYEKIKEREDARLAEDWALSDKIRDELFEMGYNLEDTPHGTIPKRKK
ncbi:cysteine--tRNA ligase [Candidatus Marinimicrobia bacterium MT.SAG.4]|nr:cysteine--tRNA ligase [Candidatus Marinimicrobia bacterium MT.SAG.4]